MATNIPASVNDPSKYRRYFPLLLFALLAVAYLPVWRAGFVWDDDAHLTANPCIVGPLGFREIWTSAEANYFPLVLSLFWILHRLVGLEPVYYHGLTLLLHFANALLVWRILRRLNVRGAWLGAALWCLHPVQVESVAWVSEFTNTLSGCCFFLAILAWLRWLDEPAPSHGRWYVTALVLSAAAMASKPSTVILPVVVLLCGGWLRVQWNWRRGLTLLPLLLLAAAASGWTIWEQRIHSRALGPAWDLPLASRLFVAARDIWFYAEKLLWPDPLIFVYPRWPISVTLGGVAALGGLVAGAILLWRGRKGAFRPLVFAFALFLTGLAPALGFFNVYYFRFSFVADHFQYLASVPLLALVGAALSRADEGRPRSIAAIGALLLVLVGLDYSRAREFTGPVELWTATLRKNPGCWMAHNNLAVTRIVEAEHSTPEKSAAAIRDAIGHFESALRLYPDYAEGHYNYAKLLARLPDGGPAAIQHYESALRADSSYVNAHTNLANLLVRAGRPDEALEHYYAAVRIRPLSAELHYNLGNALADMPGRSADAIARYDEALRLDPRMARAHHNLALELAAHRQTLPAAIDHYLKAISLDPSDAGFHHHLARAYESAGDMPRALSEYQAALRLDPQLDAARSDLRHAELRAAKISR